MGAALGLASWHMWLVITRYACSVPRGAAQAARAQGRQAASSPPSGTPSTPRTRSGRRWGRSSTAGLQGCMQQIACFKFKAVVTLGIMLPSERARQAAHTALPSHRGITPKLRGAGILPRAVAGAGLISRRRRGRAWRRSQRRWHGVDGRQILAAPVLGLSGRLVG